MIVIRDKSIKTLTKCEPFIKVITDETAIAFEKHKEEYKQSSDQIKNGLTKQDNQYYFFEHDIVNTPGIFSKHNNCFAYHIYPITDDIANRIIKKEWISKWEILFNSFLNYKKIYSMIKDYDYEPKLSYISSYMLGDKLVIPYGSSPGDMREDEMVLEDYLIKNNKRYASMNEPLKINLEVLREMKLNELNIA